MATLTKNSSTGQYVIKPGDDLHKIATSYGRTLEDLLSINPQFASNPSMVYPGQKVNLNVGSAIGMKTDSGGLRQVNSPSLNSLIPPGTAARLSGGSTPPPPAGGSGGGGTGGSTGGYSGGGGTGGSAAGLPIGGTPTTGGIGDLLSQILKGFQTQSAGAYTGNNTALLKGRENIEKTNADIYSQDFANANISNEARLGLLGSDQGLQTPGLRSIASQQDSNLAHYNTSKDLIKSTQDSYSDEQDRAFRDKQFEETVRHNKATEAAARAKATSTANGLFGNANLSTGQKNDVADMLVLGKEIEHLRGLKTEDGGYTGVSGGGIGTIKNLLAKATGITSTQAQSTRDAIGQIKGYIAKIRGGTSFTPNEQALLDTYTPGINDSDIVIETKLSDLERFINNKIESIALVAGGSYTPESTTSSGGSNAAPVYELVNGQYVLVE